LGARCTVRAVGTGGSGRAGQPSRDDVDDDRSAFGGLDVDPERVREVATLIPGAMRGLVSERQLGSYADLDVARRGLINALVAYLQAPD